MNISIENVNCTISNASTLEIERINKVLTCYAPNYQYTQMYKRKLWNGKVSLLKDNQFPTGLLPKVLKVCKNVTIEDNRNIPTISVASKTTIPLREYQLPVVNKVLNSKFQGIPWYRGIIKISCGGGKTIIAAALTQLTNLKTLFIVDRQELLVQAKNSFEKFGLQVGTIDDQKQVTIITIQSLMQFCHKTNEKTASGKVRSQEEIDSIIEKKSNKAEKYKSFLASIQQIFVDEAHGVAASIEQGNMMCKALALMPNAFMRWGLTATPFERDDYSNFLLEGSTGDLLVEISARELIDKGWLAEPSIKFYRSNITEKIPKKWPDCYNYGIVANNKRNDKIVEEAIRLSKPCLIITSSISHGQILKDKFLRKELEVPFVSGQDTSEYRNNVKDEMEKGKIPIVIANRIWNKGVDIPSVESVILAAGGGSTSTIRQIIGRGIRITEKKNSFSFVDFFDMNPQSLRKHSSTRRMVFISDGYNVIEEVF